MRKLSKKQKIFLGLAALLLGFAAFYTRPLTVPQLYPLLTLDKCTGISGFYRIYDEGDPQEFIIEKGSEDFDKLCRLLYEQPYRRKLKNLLPDSNWSIAERLAFAYTWEICFTFDGVEQPSGDIYSGDLLQIRDWCGHVSLHSDSTRLACRVHDQEAWSIQVLDILRRH